MVGKNNFFEKNRNQYQKKQRFSIKKFNVGVASVLVGSALFMFSGQSVEAAGTVDAVNGDLEISQEEQQEVDAIHEENKVDAPTMTTTTDPVTGQNIPADGGTAQMIETSKDIQIQNPELADKLEAQSDNGPSDATVSTSKAPEEPALTEPTTVENAERTDESGQVYTGQPLDNNALDAALDVNNPEGTLQDNRIVGYSVDLEDFSNPEKAGQSKLKIINRVHLSEAMPADRYEVRYEIDDRVARHITDLKYLKSEGPGISDRDFSMTRLTAIDEPNKLTNTWSMNAFDVDIVSSNLLGTNYDSMFMTTGKAPATIEVTLDTPWQDIVDAHPEARDHNDLFFNAYLWDPEENKVLKGTINSTYFQTKPNALDKRQSAGYAEEVDGNIEFTNGQAQYVEGGTVDPYTGQYDENAKVRGIAVDQQFARDTLAANMGVPTTYHFQADERLVPYIKGVGVYYLDHEGRHFDRTLQPSNQVFYNGLILNADQSGIQKTLPIAPDNRKLQGRADQYYMDYDPETGSGHFKLDPNSNGELQWNKNNAGGVISPAGLRVVYFLKDDVNIDNLRTNNLDKHYSFDGYFLDNTGKYVRNTEGKISYNFGDFGGDPSPITNEGNPGVDDTSRTNPEAQELPEVKEPTYIAEAQPQTVLLNSKVTAEDLVKAQAVDADGQAVDFPQGTVFQFVKVDAEGNYVGDLTDEAGNPVTELDTSQVGTQEVNIRVTLPRQSTSRLISGLVQVGKRPGESGQKLSEEQFIPMTNTDSRNENNEAGFLNNVLHQMEEKLTPETQAENEIDVTVSSLIHLIPSASEDTLKKWDYVIEFSDNLAKHVTKVENSKGGEFERIVNRNGDFTNSWKMRAWGGAGDRESLMTNTAVGAQYNYDVKVTLDTSVSAVLDEVKAELGREVTNGDIESTAYVYNNAEKAIVDGSYSSTFLKVQPTEYDAKESTGKPGWNNWFSLSSGRAKYFEGDTVSPYTGLTGDKVRGIAVDQIFGKSGGGSLNTIGATTDPVHYHYTVDTRLLPYLESAALYYVPNGEDHYNNSAVGKDFSYIPQAQVFFNGLDHQWDDFRNEFDPTTGEGVFKLDPANGTIARLINFDNSHLDPAAARIVYTLRDGVTLNDILAANPDATYAFTGYLTLDSGPKVRNSNANIGYTISDIDGDGIADEWQNVQFENLTDHAKSVLDPIEKAIVDKELSGTNANVLVNEARANDTSVEGLLNVGYNEGETRTVVIETVNEAGDLVQLGEAPVDPVTGKFEVEFTDPDAKLVEGQELLVSVVNGGGTVAANVQVVGAADQIVESLNNVVDLKQPVEETRVTPGDNVSVQLDQFIDVTSDSETEALSTAVPEYDKASDRLVIKYNDPIAGVVEDASQIEALTGLKYDAESGNFIGTAKLRDGEDKSEYDFTVEAVNDNEGQSTVRPFKVIVTSITELHDMAYEPVDVVPGDKAQTAEPNFTEAGTQTTSTPDLKADNPFSGPDTVTVDGKEIAVTVDPATGVVTVEPAETAKVPGQTITVPVTVTYLDGSTDEANAVINVTDPAFIDRTDNPEAPTPEGYHRVTFTAGEGVEDFGNKVYDVKEGTTVPADKVPTPVAKQGYANPVWNNDENLNPAEVVVTQDSPKAYEATAQEVEVNTRPISQNALEKTPITPIETEQVNVPEGAKVKVTFDGNETYPGLTVDPATGRVSGTPEVTWTGDDDEVRQIPVKVELLDENDQPVLDKDGQPVVNEVTIDVYRDTDGDGLPDKDDGMPEDPNNPGVGPLEGDKDDDNDGIPDTEDTNPKAWDALEVTVLPVPDQTDKVPVAEDTPAVKPNKPGATITSTPTNGLSVDENGNLVGTPDITDWGTDETERVVNIPVTVTSVGTGENGEDETQTVNVPVTVHREGDTTAPVLNVGSENVHAIEGQPITPVPVTVDDERGENIVPVLEGLPEGLTYNEDTKQIEGTVPKGVVTWTGDDHEKEDFPVKITATDAAGNEAVENITVTVYRDTDGDGEPDTDIIDPNTGDIITPGDKDDDNDGIPDTEDTSPKVWDALEVEVLPVPEQRDKVPVAEDTPAVKPNKPGATITSTPTNGLSVDENGNLVGTPDITDWGTDETERVVNIPVTVTSVGTGENGEDEVENVTVPVTVKNPNLVTEAEQYNPSYPDVSGKPGTTIEIPNTGDKLPEGTEIEVTGPEGYVIEVVPGTDDEDPKIKVTIPEDSKPGDKVELEIVVTYPDGSKDTPTETLDKDGQPVEGAPENTGLTPEVNTDKGNSAEGQPGDTVPIKDENDEPIGPGTKITERPENETGITIVDTPEGPKAVIPEDKEPGTYEVPVVIETPVNPENPDGPTIKEETTVTVTVPEPEPAVPEETQAEKHNPSYPDVGGKPGTTIEIPNTGDKLPEGTTIEVTGPEGYVIEVVPGTDDEDPKIKVTIPEDSKPGDKVELEIVVTYPDGSKDTPTETLDKDGQPVEGAPENTGLTPEVNTDKGDSAEGQPGDTVPIKDEKDQPIGPGTKITERPENDTGITIIQTPEGPKVVIPEDKEPGTYEVPVVIETPVNPEDPDGPTIREETTITVTVPEPAKPGEKPEQKPEEKPSVKEDKPAKAKTLPQTGATGSLAGFAALSVLSGLGLVSNKKRKREDEEA